MSNNCPECGSKLVPDPALDHGWFYCGKCDGSFKPTLPPPNVEPAQAAASEIYDNECEHFCNERCTDESHIATIAAIITKHLRNT